jgi:hypothetical protein
VLVSAQLAIFMVDHNPVTEKTPTQQAHTSSKEPAMIKIVFVVLFMILSFSSYIHHSTREQKTPLSPGEFSLSEWIV